MTSTRTYSVTIRGHDYSAAGYIEPCDESVGIMSEAFVLERLEPAEDGITQADADKLCDELCSYERGTEAEQDYLAMEEQVLDGLYDSDEGWNEVGDENDID